MMIKHTIKAQSKCVGVWVTFNLCHIKFRRWHFPFCSIRVADVSLHQLQLLNKYLQTYLFLFYLYYVMIAMQDGIYQKRKND